MALMHMKTEACTHLHENCTIYLSNFYVYMPRGNFKYVRQQLHSQLWNIFVHIPRLFPMFR